MSKYTATVIKTGNSIALRVPQDYAREAGIRPGDKVNLPLPTKQRSQDHAKIRRIIQQLQALNAYSTLADPAKWQHTERADRPLPDRPA